MTFSMKANLVLASFVSLTLAATGGGRDDVRPAPTDNVIPGAYLYEFEQGFDFNSFANTLESLGGDVRMRLNYTIFSGASININLGNNDAATSDSNAAAAESLASLPGVLNKWPITRYYLPDDKLESVGKLSDTTSSSLVDDSEGANSTLYMTQVNKLHAKGITGKGIKIAVIDGGINYKHPDLGGCFGKNCVVAYGYDFVGDEWQGTETPVPDDDPMDCNGHGTHVAGIIAAKNTPHGFSGVAPGVTLGAYKVFGCRGGTDLDVVVAAMSRAFDEGSQIITASLGAPIGWPDEPMALAASRIVAKGVPVTFAAGNSGVSGLFAASTGASGLGVTGVASFDNIRHPKLVDGKYIFPATEQGPGAVSDFTSWGPTWSLDLKPQFGAPGALILSTFLGNNYAVYSGTSMSTPHLAGVYALLGEARKTLNPRVLENALSLTSKAQLFREYEWTNYLASPLQQGAGLIQAFDAAYAKTIITPTHLGFNDTEFLPKKGIRVVVENTSDKSITYKISHRPTVTLYTLGFDSEIPMKFPNEPVESYATLDFPNEIVVPAGKSRNFQVKATIPANVNATRLPMYSGFLALNGSDSSSFALPYLGVAGSMRKAQIFTNYPAYIYDRVNQRPGQPGDLFTLPNPKNVNSTEGTNYPYSLAYGALSSRNLAVEVIPIVNGKDQPSLGEIYESSQKFTVTAASGVPWLSGRLKNGKYAPAGTYRFRMKALRIFGNPRKAEDLEIKESYHFEMKYKE